MIHARGNINRGGILVEKEKHEGVQDRSKKEVKKEQLKKEQPKKEFREGVVTNCLLLAVRKGPDKNCDLSGTLIPGKKVTVVVNESTDDFYSITTDDGLYGFCMKEYIQLN